MKGYKRFIFAFAVLLTLYILAEFNRPKPVNWQVTLSKEDKSPYGSYILFRQLRDLFPSAIINSFRLPAYNQVNDYTDSNTAYLLLDPALDLSRDDINELMNYAVVGNYVFISSFTLGKKISDSLHIQTSRRFTLQNQDSVRINFINPVLHDSIDYGFSRLAIDEYINKFDTLHTIVLGSNQFKEANFVKLPYGNGAFFIHANPLCFSNYFMLTRNNADYTAKALSFLPHDLKEIFWDEYYKSGPAGSDNPMRFILSNTSLRWAYRLALLAIFTFVLFEMKRRQRVIPVIPPLRNSTLDFVQTVGGVYFNRHDNKNIAIKKIQYLLEYIRAHFYLPTTHLDEDFIQSLTRKSGIAETDIRIMMNEVAYVLSDGMVNDDNLLHLNSTIDSFYKKVK